MRWNPTKEEHNYAILRPLEPWVPKEQLQEWVTFTVLRFRRRDRIQYVLMMTRMKVVLRLLACLSTTGTRIPDYFTFKEPKPQDIKKLQALYWKFMDAYTDPQQALFDEELFPMVLPPRFPNRLSRESEEELWSLLQSQAEALEHLMDTMQTGQYQTALNIPWTNQPVNTPLTADSILIEQLQAAIEEDRSKLQDDYILLEDIPRLGGRLVVDCGDGFSWRLLDTPDQRTLEAQLMDHCATTHRGVLLSLRETDPEKGMRPCLTFEYIPDQTEDIPKSVGTLGEMKGRGNSRPDVKYHPQILCLLIKPNIIGVIGGGYEEQRNFSLKDLSETHKTYLQAKRPDLFNPNLLVQTRLPELLAWAKKRLPSGYAEKLEMRITNGKHELVGPAFESTYDAIQFVADAGLLNNCDETVKHEKLHKVFEELAQVVEGRDLSFYSSGKTRETTLDDMVSNMNGEPKERFKSLLSELAKRFHPDSSEIVVQNFLNNDWDEVPEEVMDILFNASLTAEEIGWETGTVDQIHKELKNIFPLTTTSGIVTETGFVNDAKTLLERGTHGEENSEMDYEECRRVVRIVWRAAEAQDYDSEAAHEYFLERLYEEVP